VQESISYGAFLPFLETMRLLLRKHSRFAQAEVIDTIMREGGAGSERFVTELQGGLFWGGSGSVVDALSLEDPPRDWETEQESIEFTRAVVKIAEEMEAQGIACERSRLLGPALQEGLVRRSEVS
jgi:hypothetical protein